VKRQRAIIVGPPTDLTFAVDQRLSARRDTEIVAGPARQAEHDALAQALVEDRIDTVVHTGLVSWGRDLTADVIGTMRLAAAVTHPDAVVQRVVVTSSTAVYPATSRGPKFHRESETIQPDSAGIPAQLFEAESYVRKLAADQPNIDVCVLRLADLAGTRPGGPLAELLRAPLVPAVAGFDPMITLLHIDDAAAAIEHAVTSRLAGTYNVAAPQPMRWRAAVRLIGSRVQHVPLTTAWLRPLGRWSDGLLVPPELFDVLRFGRCVDTTLISGTGYRPRHTTADCVRMAAT